MAKTDLQPISLPNKILIGSSEVSTVGEYDKDGNLVAPGPASILAIGVMVVDPIDRQLRGGPSILFTSPASIQL